MSRVTLVTGATGLIGGYVLRRGLDRGERIRVLVRRPDAIPDDVRRRVEVVAGDLRDAERVARAVRGARAVLHLAACARAWTRDPGEFHAVNVEAVERIVDAAEREAVERLVHVSTILTLPAFRRAPVNGAASNPTPYEVTKRAGERRVEAYAAAGGHAVIVHPTRVYGPGPLTDANAVTRAILLYRTGRLRLRLADADALASYVHVEDVAEGIWLAAERGASGAHYVLGGENASFRELLDLVDDVTGTHRRTLELPPSWAVAIARAAEWWGRRGGEVPITPGWVRVLLEDRRVDVEPARRALGYAPRALRAGLRQTIAWLDAREGQRARTGAGP